MYAIRSLPEVVSFMHTHTRLPRFPAQRYLYYINNGIDTDHVAPLEEVWLAHVLGKIPRPLKARCAASIERLSEEMREDYLLGVKKSIGG